jgi:hypothetical protein
MVVLAHVTSSLYVGGAACCQQLDPRVCGQRLRTGGGGGLGQGCAPTCVSPTKGTLLCCCCCCCCTITAHLCRCVLLLWCCISKKWVLGHGCLHLLQEALHTTDSDRTNSPGHAESCCLGQFMTTAALNTVAALRFHIHHAAAWSLLPYWRSIMPQLDQNTKINRCESTL